MSYLEFYLTVFLTSLLTCSYYILKHRRKLGNLEQKIDTLSTMVEDLNTYVETSDTLNIVTNVKLEKLMKGRLDGIETRQELAIEDLNQKMKGFKSNFMNNY